MKMKLTLLSTFLIITVICLTRWGYVLFNKYDSLYISYKEELNITFHQAVLAETQKRLVDTNTLFIKRNNIKRKRPEQIRIISESDTVSLKRTEEYERLSIDEKDDLFLQTFLAEESKNLDVNSLNQIWVEKLKEKKLLIYRPV